MLSPSIGSLITCTLYESKREGLSAEGAELWRLFYTDARLDDASKLLLGDRGRHLGNGLNGPVDVGRIGAELDDALATRVVKA